MSRSSCQCRYSSVTSLKRIISFNFFTFRLGKTVICSQDYSGFIVNRILIPMINEAFFALYTGVATKEDIDTGMKLGTNHPMGPLELADFIGLDVCLSIMKVLHSGLGDGKYAPCPLLVQYVDAGRLGRKRGIGVYDYRKVTQPKKSTSRLWAIRFCKIHFNMHNLVPYNHPLCCLQ